ncbi:transcriptional regulator [Halomarina litorea]|uniref:transcriptional regulator n=1 Tax=Halomarina litorea TaxID=2961595 RepID=UPI0020C3C82D|nr:transcriptional regulator [Halomarina sp. BCD28]
MPGKDRDEDSGRYTDTYTADDMLNAIRDEGGTAGTTDVANAVGCARDTAYKKLKSLEENGAVTGRKIGGTMVWTIAEN